MEKNQVGKWVVFAFGGPDHASAGEPITGDAANITANVRIDGGAANAVDDTNPTELEDGYYVFDITAAESNGDMLLIAPASSTSNVQVIGVPGAIFTSPPNYNAASIDGSGHVTLADGSLGDAKLAGGLETVFETDFAANYSTSLDGWNVNTKSIGGNITASTNLGVVWGTSLWVTNIQDMYDGTGYAGGTTKLQVDSVAISGSTAAADNVEANIGNLDASIAGLNNISAADVNAQCDAAIETYGLDHLVSAAAIGTDITDNSIIARMAASGSTADWDTFDNTADSLQAISESGGGGPTAEQIADQVWDEARSGHIGAGSFGETMGTVESNIDNLDASVAAVPTAAENRTEMDSNSTQLAAIVGDTNELQADWANGGRLDNILDARASQTTADAIETDTQDLQTQIGTAGAGLTAVPWSSAWDAEVQSEVTDALNATISEAYPADTGNASIAQMLYAMMQFLVDKGFSGTTGTVKKRDGSTTAYTVTLDDSVNPTQVNGYNAP